MPYSLEVHADASHTIGYLQYGAGPTPVMVFHDWLGDHHSYDALLPWLDASRYTYVFVDLRGYGLSITLRGAYTIDEAAADCLALADRLGWTQFHVLGHSMTGMLTQRLAADAPARILSAIAVCPISAAGNRLSPQARAFFDSTQDDDEALSHLFQFVSRDLSAGWAAHKVAHHRQAVAPACRRAYLDMLVAADFAAEVQGLNTPFLIMIGEHDPGLDEAAMAQTFLAWHPGAELLIVPNSGHYPMQECPPYFAAQIERFLAIPR